MSTRGKVRIKGKTYAIPHDAYPSGFGADLVRVVKTKTRTFRWLSAEYDLSRRGIPKGIWCEYEYKAIGKSVYVRELLYDRKTRKASWSVWKRLS